MMDFSDFENKLLDNKLSNLEKEFSNGLKIKKHGLGKKNVKSKSTCLGNVTNKRDISPLKKSNSLSNENDKGSNTSDKHHSNKSLKNTKVADGKSVSKDKKQKEIREFDIGNTKTEKDKRASNKNVRNYNLFLD